MRWGGGARSRGSAAAPLLALALLPLLLVRAGAAAGRPGLETGGRPEPFFRSDSGTVVRTPPLGTAALHCRVAFQGGHTVSWVRRSGLQILSVGSLLFSSDPRLSITFLPWQRDHVLTLQQVEERDLGMYECQVNTSPPRFLTVELALEPPGPAARPRAHAGGQRGGARERPGGQEVMWLLGGQFSHVEPGGLANLTCVLRSQGQAPRILWSKDGAVISYYSGRGGVSLVGGGDSQLTWSSLLLREAEPADQGTYTCRKEGSVHSAVTSLIISHGGLSHASRSAERRPGVSGLIVSLCIATSSRIY